MDNDLWLQRNFYRQAQQHGWQDRWDLKDLCTFCNTKHRFTLNLQSLKIMIVESLPLNISLLRFCTFGEMSKTMSRKYVLHARIIFVSWENNYFRDLFYPFLEIYSTSASNILREAFYCHYLQTVWVWCKSVNG